MDLKKSSITADILNFISDGKIHTLQEIADEVEVSKMTVRRHIQSLSFCYPIDTFHGGDKKGGVRLNCKKKINVNLSDNELQLVIQHLRLLQNSSVNIKAFINSLCRLNEKE